jgi:hypothetical protein
MTESCPRCGALVTFYASDIGETISCRSCNEPLKVTSDGLRAAAAKGAGRPSAPPPVPRRSMLADDDAPASSSGGGGSSGGGTVFDAVGVLLGFLFLPGLFLTLLFLLAPAIDRAFAETNRAKEIELDLPVTKARQDLKRKKEEKLEDVRKKERELNYKQDDLNERNRDWDKRNNQLYSKGNPPQKDVEAMQKEKEGLNKEQDALYKDGDRIREERTKVESGLNKDFRADEEKINQDERDNAKKRDQLELDRISSGAGFIRRSAWYQGGLLVGVLILMVGSVGYLSSRQSMVRRVVGAIAIGAVVLFIAARMNSGRGVLLGMNAGGGGGGGNLAAYDLSTPSNAYASLPKMVLNNDFHSLIAMENRPGGADFLKQMEDMQATLKFHKEVHFEDSVILFVSFEDRGKTVHRTEGMRFDPVKNIWQLHPVFDFTVEKTNPSLAREMREWNQRDLPQKNKVPEFKDKDV